VGNLSLPDPRVTNPELFDLRNPDAPIPQFVNAMKMAGIEITAEQVAQGITYEALKDKDSNPFVVAVYKLDSSLFLEQYRDLAGPIPLMIVKRGENAEWRWERVTGRNLPPFQIAAKVGFGDGNDSITLPYQNVLAQQFGAIIPQAAFMEKHMHSQASNRALQLVKPYAKGTENIDFWLAAAVKNNQSVVIHSMFNYKDLPNNKSLNTQKEVDQYMDDRIREVLRYLVKYDKVKGAKIVLANEPFYNDKAHPDSGWVTNNPYYKIYKERWITEAYLRLKRIAENEFNIALGKEGIQVIGINGLNPMSRSKNYYIDQVKNIKRDIASRLGIPVEQVPFDVGLIYYFGYPASTIDNPISFSSFNTQNIDQVAADLKDIATKTNSRLHILEVGGNGNINDVSVSFLLLGGGASKSGVVDTLGFWQVLDQNRFDATKTFPNPLINEDYTLGIPFYFLMKGIYNGPVNYMRGVHNSR